jgi:hypothetical protein
VARWVLRPPLKPARSAGLQTRAYLEQATQSVGLCERLTLFWLLDRRGILV